MPITWRDIADLVKHNALAMRAADFLGRRRGRLALLDRLAAPPPPAPVSPDLSDWEARDLAACWIGHATVLLRVGSTTVLTDPVFSNRVGIGLGLLTAGPQRLLAPALTAAELPRVDAILVSHAHFDHLDRPTLARLPRSIPVVTAPDNADLIRDLGFRDVRELRWRQTTEVGALRLTAWEAAHWGARTFFDAHRGFNAFVLESAAGDARCRRVLYAGDTAFCDHFKEVGKVDLAVFGIGGYDPYVAAHATPEQAWTMAGEHVMADAVLPMHHSTFRLSCEPTGEPIERFLEAAGGEVGRVVVRQVGETWKA